MQATSSVSHFYRGKLVPARDTGWMRGALMERKDWNRKEEIGGKGGKMVTALLM